MVARSEDIGTDALLVAYLDGELEPEAHQEVERRLRSDPSLRSRLTTLAESVRPIRSSFDVLLGAAPRTRLESAFSAALAKSPARGRDRFPRRLLAAAAAVLLLVVGGIAGYFVAKSPVELFEETDTVEEEWVAAVAGQLSLYDADAVA
jgi:anti-sigma factor RsiW